MRNQMRNRKVAQALSALMLLSMIQTPLLAAIEDRIEYKLNRVMAKVENLSDCIDANCNIDAGNVTVNGQLRVNHVTKPLTKADVERRRENGLPAERYDIIIVGTGPAGSVLTLNLAERYPTAKILVLDVGQDDVRITDGFPTTPSSVVPNPNVVGDTWGQLLRSTATLLGEGCAQWQVEVGTTSNVQDVSVPVEMPRGATLGGTSAINATFWNRGTKEGTYDRWEDATGDARYGYTSMVDAYKKIENRTQSTRYFGSAPIRYWDPISGPTPGQTLNNLMGTTGNLFLASTPFTGYSVRAAQESAQALPFLPGRTSTIAADQADVDDANTAIEYNYLLPFSLYDQSDPNFPAINPYLPSAPDFTPTPGYTYTPPADPANAKGPEYFGSGLNIPVANTNARKALTARCFAAPAYLYPIMDNKIPHNVTIKERVYVTELLFDATNPTEVIGVKYAEGPNGEGWQVSEINRAIARDVAPYKGTLSGTPTVTAARALCSSNVTVKNQNNCTINNAYAAADIWLCAGAIDSPAIMQRSGIGPQALLDSLRFQPVATRVDLPGVGTTAQDTLDIMMAYLQEMDCSTRLAAPAAAGQTIPTYLGTFGLADPTNPLNQAGTASMGGAAVNALSPFRVQSDPTKRYADTDILVNENPLANALGGQLYQDFVNSATGRGMNINYDTTRPIFDRALWGMWDPIANPQYLHMKIWFLQYWDVVSQGTVAIRSGNVFERPEYSPNMLADDRDTKAIANNFTNFILPMSQRMAFKRFGPRGSATYAGIATAGGASTITLNASLGAVKPIIGNINQATYDTAGSLIGYRVAITSGTGAGQTGLITAWTGAPLYVATVSVPWTTVPDATSNYALNPPGSTPLDSVEFNDNNHRNFVRFAHPHGDELFSAVKIVTASVPAPITFTTTAASTRVRITQTAHGFSDGDMIKIDGIAAPIDNIAASNFNDYHIVYVVDANNYDIILFWNVTPVGGPGSAQVPNPAAAAVGAVTVFTVAGSVNVSTLHFDQKKFDNWLLNHYFSGWHPCCTCLMGKPEDTEAVVDTHARVYDTKGLRVCDASIFPVKPNGNTQAPAYGISQKVFDIVSVEEYDNLLS